MPTAFAAAQIERIRTAWTTSVTANTPTSSRGRARGSGGRRRRRRAAVVRDAEPLEQRPRPARAAGAPSGRRRGRRARASRGRRRPRARGTRSRRSVPIASRNPIAPSSDASPRRRGRARAGRSPVTSAVRPGMPACRLDDAHRVAAERRRQHLARRVGDEVRPRQPREAARRCRCARSSHCQRRAMGRAVPIMIATASRNHHGLASTRMSTVWSDVDLPDEVGEREPRQQERAADPERSLHEAKRAWTRRSASIASSMSSSECAGESGSESTSSPARSATGSRGCAGNRSR